MRSKLFVPGSRPELFRKALDSQADAISFDLEDSVLESRKDYAREELARFLDDAGLASSGKKIIVRVNGMDTSHFLADLAVCCHPAVHILNIPKIESQENALDFFAHLEDMERKKSLPPTISLLANIETPQSVRRAGEIAASHPRIGGLQLGLGDLFEPLGIARYNTANVHAMMFTLRMAAGEASVYAYDSAYADVKNTVGYREEALMARSLGFLGKTCIHPSQVKIANEVFSPTPAEVEWAQKVTQAAQSNQDNGAFLLDGKMVDAPFVHRAHEVVRNAQKLNLIK
jgi:citrate lyase subunit beta/citryl-CoA lyase